MAGDECQLAEILLIEDDPADVILFRQAVKESKSQFGLHVESDGESALSRLRGQQPFGSSTLPDLVLLDLNLPGNGGREVLGEIKTDEGLKHVPVIVWSTAEDPLAFEECYRLSADSVLVKPGRFCELVTWIVSLRDNWGTNDPFPQ